MRKHLYTLSAIAIAALTATSASADNTMSLHLEPGMSIPLTSPQSDIYTPGPSLSAKAMYALYPTLSVGPSVSALYWPRATDNTGNAGVMWQFGGSLRLQTDRRNTNTSKLFSQVSPWADLDASLAATGNLLRPAVSLGLGYEVPLDRNHIVWTGPFVRYTHMFQTADTESGNLLDPNDVNIAVVGWSLSFDAPTTPVKELVQTTTVQTVVETVPCPTCSVPAVVAKTVAPAPIAITEKVYFDHDSSSLRWESMDKLDAVVAKLNGSKVVINVQGHASSDGQLAHNVALSAKRTAAVVAYLVAHGVDGTRLQSASFGISQPAAPNTTKVGRERNRRVEFTVEFTEAK